MTKERMIKETEWIIDELKYYLVNGSAKTAVGAARCIHELQEYLWSLDRNMFEK